ncbi:MAG TPA: hypothetical protein VKV27_05155 [Solirubrobacteraceae bacterium]|nr:hypothetical protein [Solirubrobacteraceae bacterium]
MPRPAGGCSDVARAAAPSPTARVAAQSPAARVAAPWRAARTATWPRALRVAAIAIAAAALAPGAAAALPATGPAAGAALPVRAVAALAAPTLGLPSVAANGAGFGRVRPREISYGGDPTSLVTGVRWSSWGGARAVGHGVADWVWPGWCVACGGVRLHATVVAFGLTTCDGHSAYAYVEWYFPSRGMSFDRRLAGVNLCTGAASSPGTPAHQGRCGRVALRSGGRVVARARGIQTFGAPIACATVRRFVASSGAARHLGANARFTVRGWWCGSELSMDLGGPQTFSCVRGDFDNISFQLLAAR